MTNEYRDIVGYEGLYQVSNFGKVKSLERKVNAKNNTMAIRPEKLLKGSVNVYGYPCVHLIKDGVVSGKFIHRLVAQAFIPNPESKPCINHIDGIKTNNDVNNLEWCTYSENNIHSYKIGLATAPFGEKCGAGKLTEIQVLEIREKYKSKKYYQYELAEIYKVHQTAIHKIVANKTWRHI